MSSSGVTRIVPSGSIANHLRRDNMTITPSTSFATSFPITNLYDNRSDLIGQFNSLTTDPYITIDKNIVLNATLNTWTTSGPTSWTVSNQSTAATVTEATSSGQVVTGSAAKLTAATSGAYAAITQNLEYAPGDLVRLEGQLMGDSTNAAKVQLRNLQTGNYLTTAQTWSTANSVCATRTTQVYGVSTLDFEVEDFLTCDGMDTVQLQLILISSSVGTAYFDDWTSWPVTRFMSIHGHNIDPSVTVQWRDSNDGFGSNDDLIGTFSVVQPSFYHALEGTSLERYQRIKFSGTQSTRSGAIWLGEWFVGQSLALARNQNYGYLSGTAFPQDRNYTRGGHKTSLPLSEHERRSADMTFFYPSLASYQEARDQIFRRSFGGHYPTVLVPDDSDTEVCLFGYVVSDFSVSRAFINQWDATFRFEEEPFPIVTA